jgi:RimJ/RimL family protein N-acetyltransferase
MPEPSLRPVTGVEADALARFLSDHQWPFHVRARLGAAEAAEQVAGWGLDRPSCRAWWLERDGAVVGLLRVEDLDAAWDPSWDLRIAEGHRGAGLGTAAVRWLSGEVFRGWPGVRRIEAQTRRDNLAMRTVLARCGYVKEAHYRRAWPDQDGGVHDGIGYALLREDWELGTTTPVDWDDEPPVTRTGGAGPPAGR